MKKEKEEENNKVIIAEYQKIVTKNIYLLVFSSFFIILSVPLAIHNFGRGIWGIFIIGIILYNCYFTFKVNRCPNCKKKLPNFCLNLEKCPYCSICFREQ